MQAFFNFRFLLASLVISLYSQNLFAQTPTQLVEQLSTLVNDARRQASFAKADCRVADKHLKTALQRQSELEAMQSGFPALNSEADDAVIQQQLSRSEEAANTAFINARIATDSIRGACQGAFDGSGRNAERLNRAPEVMRNTLKQIQDTQVQIALARHRLARISEQRGYETDNPTTQTALRQALSAAAQTSLAAISNPLEKSVAARLESEAQLAQADTLMGQLTGLDAQVTAIGTTLDDVRASQQQARLCHEQVSSALPTARTRIGFPPAQPPDATPNLQRRTDPEIRKANERINNASARVESALLHVARLEKLAGQCAAVSKLSPTDSESVAAELANLQMPDANGIARVPEPGNFGDCDGLYRFWQLKTGCRFEEALAVLATRTSGLACLEFSDYINGEREHVSLLAHNEQLITRLLGEGEEQIMLSEKTQALEQYIAARSFARCQTQQEAASAGIARALSLP